MKDFSPGKFFDLSDFQYAELFQDVTNAWEVLPKLSDFLHAQFEKGIVRGNYKDKKDVFIGEGTVIQNGSEIIGPAIIGRNCILSHAALIRGNCLLGDNVNIGHAVEIKYSICLKGAAVAHLNYIGNSIIGNNVNISGGAILANHRLDRKLIAVRDGDKKTETNLQKFGAIIGDNSNIGVNAVLNPGTLLGKNTVVYPLISVTGIHKENEIIKK